MYSKLILNFHQLPEKFAKKMKKNTSGWPTIKVVLGLIRKNFVKTGDQTIWPEAIQSSIVLFVGFE
jgi:hypothetical protein